MNSPRFEWLRIVTVCSFCLSVAAISVFAQDADPDEAKEKTVADQFVKVLEKNPRRGTALDKVYGFHVERGSLDGLIKSYREKIQTANAATAGPTWMIVGLLESLRGQDAAAVTAFEQAEKRPPENYLASYYLGQSLILVGQPDKAAEALERAVERKPAQADLLDVYQALGRVYQRAQKADQALNVWSRLEKQFPNDVRVQEQIATTLLEENEYAAALPRYEALAKNTKDKYRQSLFQMEAADIKVRLGQSAEAIKEFETLLGQLLPENWLYREVRRRIEAVYLRTDDQAGLIAYYEAWLKKSPQDLEVMSRLSRLLSGYGRTAEAQTWLENGLKLAPKKKELRQALITQFVYDHKYAAAIAQYEQLDKYEPNNPDTLREWGRLILKDASRDEAARKTAAVAVWNRMTAAKPKDPFVVSQVAEQFRQAEMTDAALEQYQKAVALAPDQSQYREYLGEYFHTLKRKDEALATWRGIAEGKQKTAPNLARLAEVLASFGYITEAVGANGEACQLDPKDFALQLKRVDLLAQANNHDRALEQLTKVKALAANDEEREAWLMRDLRELQAADKLKDRIEVMAKDEQSRDADHWFWLARAYEAQRQLKQAAKTVEKASSLTPQSIPVLSAAARIYETQNNLMAAVEINTKLAAIDRRYRTEYLKQVATLEQKLGRRDRAIQAGRDLIAAAPGNPELYEFFSQLCFQLGDTEEGLGALRRSVRVNPADAKGMLLLASALSEQFRTSEAIELYWRAFDKAPHLDDRLTVIQKLAELYLQTNQYDRLLERLERQRREPNQQREMTICIAQAHQSAGDDGNARQELEKLLADETRDTQLLAQLVKLCEADGDYEAAVKFQQQLLKTTPGKEGSIRLAQLLTKSGETEEGAALLSRLVGEEKDLESGLKSIDELLKDGNTTSALTLIQKRLADQPGNWELTYREGVALAKSENKKDEAKSRFEAILALTVSDEELSLAMTTNLKRTAQRTQVQSATVQRANVFLRQSTSAARARQAAGLVNANRLVPTLSSGRVVTSSGLVMAGQTTQFWAPPDFASARIGSLAWLDAFARARQQEAEFLNTRRELGEKSDDLRRQLDWYYLTLVTGDTDGNYAALKRLAKRTDADAGVKYAFLRALSTRDPGAQRVNPNQATDDEAALIASMPALPPDELQDVLQCFQSLMEISDASVIGYPMLPSVMIELKRAGRREEADKLRDDLIQNANNSSRVTSLLSSASTRNDLSTILNLLDKLVALAPNDPIQGLSSRNATVSRSESQARQLSNLMGQVDQKQRFGDALEIWDHYVPLALIRREQHKRFPTAAGRRGQNSNVVMRNGRIAFTVNRNGSLFSESVDFPSPNEVYDLPSIQLLRQLFFIYQGADSLRSLTEHFDQRRHDASLAADQRVFWQMGQGYLHWWRDDKAGAISILTDALEDLGDQQELKFELACMYEKAGEPALALEMIDALAPPDQQAMQEREITALRMAVNSGNIDRARIAADRLFGLRLDSQIQIQLAQQMHQLGQHEQAEALLARAGRQAGNRTDVMLTLMQQYQSQAKNDVAAEIAYQLLRRSEKPNSDAINLNSAAARRISTAQLNNGEGSVRQQALTILNRSGKLAEMVKKIETQLQRSPNSQRLIETLMEYAAAEGDSKRVNELTARLVESKRDVPQFRYEMAQKLIQQGQHKEAIEHLRVAITKDPQLVRRNYSQIVRSYQTAKLLPELVPVLESLDLKAYPEGCMIVRYFLQVASREEQQKEACILLFKKAWSEVPAQRAQLISGLNADVFYQMPEVYQYVVEAVIPTEAVFEQRTGWAGFGAIQQYNNNGTDGTKIVTQMTRFLALAQGTNRLDDLSSKIEHGLQKVPNWDGGKALRGMVNLRLGRLEQARDELAAILPTAKASTNPNVWWEIGQELAEHESCIDLAISYLEGTQSAPGGFIYSFNSSPAKPLLALYKRRGRKAEARRLILELSKPRPAQNPGNEDMEACERVQRCPGLGQELIALGSQIDALRIYQNQLSRPEDFVAFERYYGNPASGKTQADHARKQIEASYRTALKTLKPEMLGDLLRGSRVEGIASAIEPTNGIHEPFDLLMHVESRDLDTTCITSVVSTLVTEVADQSTLRDEIRAALDELQSDQPDDIAGHILSLQLALSEKDAARFATGTQHLVELIDQHPLEVAAKTTMPIDQRQSASRQIPLWLVARECLKDASLREAGTKLAERALEAARRQTDNGFALAILREWGQLALEAGDRTTAEKLWTEMLSLVIPEKVDRPVRRERPDRPLRRTDNAAF